jgi:hypothetical protein
MLLNETNESSSLPDDGRLKLPEANIIKNEPTTK